jgi:hypothetical protein
MTKTRDYQKSKAEQDHQLSKELAMTFPASDPPASSQPGGGVTGPETHAPKPAATKGTK